MANKGGKGPVDPKWLQKRNEFLKATVELHRLRAELAKIEADLIRRGIMAAGDGTMMW